MCGDNYYYLSGNNNTGECQKRIGKISQGILRSIIFGLKLKFNILSLYHIINYNNNKTQTERMNGRIRVILCEYLQTRVWDNMRLW